MVNGANDSEIEVFDTEGNFIIKIGDGRCNISEEERNDKVKMAQPHECDGSFNTPEHLNFNSNGNIWVVDKGSQQMQLCHCKIKNNLLSIIST
jgi:hypothetical protein